MCKEYWQQGPIRKHIITILSNSTYSKTSSHKIAYPYHSYYVSRVFVCDLSPPHGMVTWHACDHTSCSGDGFLTAIDLRMKKVEQKSDQMESELLCVEVMKVAIYQCCGNYSLQIINYNCHYLATLRTNYHYHYSNITSN